MITIKKASRSHRILYCTFKQRFYIVLNEMRSYDALFSIFFTIFALSINSLTILVIYYIIL